MIIIIIFVCVTFTYIYVCIYKCTYLLGTYIGNILNILLTLQKRSWCRDLEWENNYLRLIIKKIYWFIGSCLHHNIIVDLAIYLGITNEIWIYLIFIFKKIINKHNVIIICKENGISVHHFGML